MEITNYRPGGDKTAVHWSTAVVTFCRRIGIPSLIVGLFTTVGQAQTVEYSIGEPTADEQLSLELMNRARANPTEEGEILAQQAGALPGTGEDVLADPIVSVYSDVDSFNTNLTVMKSEMAAISATPPLSFNEDLLYIARLHNANMLASNSQTHYSTGTSKHYWARMDNNGYVWSEAGENIFASTLDVVEAHASFEIDWGSGTNGMQSGRGHRVTIHSDKFREVGIGYLEASASNVGPALLTQNFGERVSRSSIKPYVTGVAIYDADGDGFYDIGEGISGVTVTVAKVLADDSRQVEDHYAVTSGSGGYSVPVDAGAGNYEVTFTLPGGATKLLTTTITSEIHTEFNPDWERGFNVKADLIVDESSTPAYTPPVSSGSAEVVTGSTSVIDFSDVAGATEYEVLAGDYDSSPLGQDADVAAPVTTDKSSSYALVSVPSSQGDRLAFHLAHPGSSSTHQSMTLDRVFIPGAAAEISFDSRLRKTGTAQIASLQVTADWGRTWKDVWFHQANNSLANSFTPVTVDVSEFDGQPIKFRFLFYLGGGSVDYGSGSTFGWHFDDLVFSGMGELSNFTQTEVVTSEYTFSPPSDGSYHFQVRARTGAEFLRYANPSVFFASTNDYASWVTRQESSSGVAAGALVDSHSDFDGDGLTQLAEYGLEASGLNPTQADASSVPTAVLEGTDLCVHYTIDTTRLDVSVEVQVSTDLSDWYSPGDAGAPAGFTDTDDGSGSENLQNRTAAVPFGSHELLFMRIKVSEVTPVT